eukprot:7589096-Karenia_brevis.AAC.1
MAPKPNLTQVHNEIAKQAGNKISAKEVREVLNALQETIVTNLHEKGNFTLHGLVSFRIFHKSATPSKKKKAFGKEIQVEAKSARKVVKVQVLKQLNDTVGA